MACRRLYPALMAFDSNMRPIVGQQVAGPHDVQLGRRNAPGRQPALAIMGRQLEMQPGRCDPAGDRGDDQRHHDRKQDIDAGEQSFASAAPAVQERCRANDAQPAFEFPSSSRMNILTPACRQTGAYRAGG